MKVIGINAYYHDSAAAIIIDGNLIFAIEEERLTEVKHDNSFPINAINKCLDYCKLDINDIDEICYYEKPLLKFERILESVVRNFPKSFRIYRDALPEWLGEKITIENQIRKKTGYRGKITFSSHHLSHASATYFTSGFSSACIVTIDGVGEHQTTVIWKAKNKKIIPIREINYPNSLGLLYSTFTSFLGFEVNEGEYKLMGLASFGRPIYVDMIMKIIDVSELDGSFRLKMKYFDFESKPQMWSKQFIKLFGEPVGDGKYKQFHKNLAASIQVVIEETVIKILDYAHKITNEENICIGGGVGLNAVLNGKITSRSKFKKLYVFGPAGDSGCAIGAAMFAYINRTGDLGNFSRTTLLLGNKYGDEEIEHCLDRRKLKYQKLTTTEKIEFATNALIKGKVIGWFQGRMEFGPRALGNRSILSAPFPYNQKSKVNKIKIREQFRPFAGVIRIENVKEFFEGGNNLDLSMMNVCLKVRDIRIKNIPAITHVDRTCRIQTVDKKNGDIYQLLDSFGRRTGIPVLLNTSFNLKKQPIVENPNQAIEMFLKTKLDCLIIGSFVVKK